MRTLQKQLAAGSRRLRGDDAAFLARPLRERDILARLGDRRKSDEAQNIAVRKDAADQNDLSPADLAFGNDGIRRELARRVVREALCAFFAFEGIVPHRDAALAVGFPPGAENFVPDWALILYIHACKVFQKAEHGVGIAAHVPVHDVGHGADDPRSALFHPLYDAIFQPVLVGDRKEWREKNFVPVQTVLRVDDVHIVVAEGGIILFNKLGTVACGSAATEIVFYGCGVEWEFSSVTAKEITYVPEKAPVSADEPGNIEYYTDGTNYWLPDGTVTTPEETVVKYEVEVTLTLEGVALDGETLEAVAEGTVLTFTSARSVYTYTVGQGEALRLSPDTYTVTANGYKTASLTVTEGTTEYTLTLYRTIAYASNDKVTVDDKNGTINIKGDVADYTSKQWSGSAELALSDEVKQSTNVTLEFTVRNVTNSQSGWPENEWASQRLAIQMAEGYEGFMFFLPTGEANIFDMTDGGIADSGKTRFGTDGHTYDWIDTLMRETSGVNMRIVREGANVTLLVQNAEEAWIEIGTVTCASADAATEIVFYGCGVEWEFSSITVTPNVQE